MRHTQQEGIDGPADGQSARSSLSGTTMNRRGFLTAATATVLTSAVAARPAMARNFGPQTEPIRYPDPDIVVLDKRFKYKLGNAAIMRLHTGMQWAEGPAWNAVGRYLVWSDIPNNEQLRWSEEDGHVAVAFARPLAIPMEIPLISKGACSRASMIRAALYATSTTAR